MTTIDGRPVRLLGTHQAPGCLIDTWETPDEEPGSDFRTGLVVTVTVGQEIAAEPRRSTNPVRASEDYVARWPSAYPKRWPRRRWSSAPAHWPRSHTG